MALNKSLSYITRVFALIMVFTWIIAFSLYGIFFLREKELKVECVNAQLQIYNTQLLQALNGGGIEDGLRYIRDVSTSDSIRFTILNLQGQVLYDTHSVVIGSDHSKRPEVRDAALNGKGFTINRTSTSDSRDYFYSASKDGDYIVRASIPYDVSLVKALDGEVVYLWTVLIILLALSVIAFFASRQFGKNIELLRDFAVKAERNESFHADYYAFANDELGDIAKQIVKLYNSLQSALYERDKYYKNLLHEEQEKTRIKHQLTNNINHEIKTPVHAIQGCLETVIDNKERFDKSQVIDFVVKAQEQVKRLIALLSDVSMITLISEASQHIITEDIDLVEVIGVIKGEMSMLPIEKQMRLNVNLPTDMKLKANRELLESVFRNLVVNSLAYSGGRDIFITLMEDDGKRYVLSFADNGVGVGSEHLSRLFERFYRIDDGRSRRMGGTGLGLSIVKNAVLFHGGEIIAKIRDGGGLEFIFSLNKTNK